MESGDLATWVGSIGVVLGALGTIGTLIWAVHGTLEEAKKSRALAAATEEERRAEERERVRSQAQRVYAWIGDPPASRTRTFAEANNVGVYLGNSSNEPVYNVVAFLVWVQGAAFRTGEEAESYANSMADSGFSIYSIRTVVQNLPPGRFIVELKGADNSPMQGQLGVEVAFTDRDGKHWVRRATGELEELGMTPLEHYNVHRPLRYDTAVPTA
ncbi:hypothetical protein NWP13_22125 [Rhodococcus pyridinivorans]|nr:hypothetical protein [Rhodococcus pyridinivorans]